jgi:proton-translocating NADH-quinone oxidoreductase chain N
MKALDALFFTILASIIVQSFVERKKHFWVFKAVVLLGLLSSSYFLVEAYLHVSETGVMLDALGSSLIAPAALNLRIDALGVFMALICIALCTLATVYSFSYIDEEANAVLYYILLTAMTLGMLGIFFAADFITLIIFWELMSIPSYTLVFFKKHRWESIEAALKYTVMSIFGNAFIVLAASLLYGMTGTVDILEVATRLGGASNGLWVNVTALLFITGFGVKTAIFPLHTWLPDAHPAAPSPISALLSGVMIATGMYMITRVLFTVFAAFLGQWTLFLAVISVLTMSVGNIMAFNQQDVKRLLAYSSVAHMGYILSGVSAGTPLGLEGAFFHLLNHAFMKALAFLCVGAYIFRSGSRNINDLAGIGHKMPVTTISLSLSLFALMGIPPFSSFLSEVLLFQSNIAAGNVAIAAFLLMNSVLASIYYLRLLLRITAKKSSKRIQGVQEAPTTMLISIAVISITIILFTVFSDSIIIFIRDAVNAIIP